MGNTGGESDSDPLLTYKVGMGQILVEGGAVEANLNRAVSMIEQAAKSGCRIVVLPECLDCGWTYPESAILAQPVPGESSDVLAKAALKNNIYVVAGLTEKAGERIYNTAVLIADTGDILLKHRKINVLTIAQDIYAIGDRLGVAHTPLGTIGIDICADNFPDTLVLGHSLARMGAQLILAPSAWAVDADHDNNKNPYGGSWMRSHSELARLYDLTVMSVSNVGWINAGVWKGRKCIGCSLAVGPGGNKLAESPYGETAEHLTVVEVTILPRVVTGTAITEMLRKKGN
ncbi:MAG: carbon-nitrogen hydrolase family protein [Candidatus Aminicenantes bacterium]|nr:carbon-nitrogen hydrolase family protein [Candidatus Aminicenantes bacterium]